MMLADLFYTKTPSISKLRDNQIIFYIVNIRNIYGGSTTTASATLFIEYFLLKIKEEI